MGFDRKEVPSVESVTVVEDGKKSLVLGSSVVLWRRVGVIHLTSNTSQDGGFMGSLSRDR